MSTNLHEFIATTVEPLLRDAGITTREGAPRLHRNHDLEFTTATTDTWGLTGWYRETKDRWGPVFSITADLRGTPLGAEIHRVMRLTPGPQGTLMVDPLSDHVLCALRDQEPREAFINLWRVFRAAICPLLYQGQWRFWPDQRDARIWQCQQLRRIRRFYETT